MLDCTWIMKKGNPLASSACTWKTTEKEIVVNTNFQVWYSLCIFNTFQSQAATKVLRNSSSAEEFGIQRLLMILKWQVLSILRFHPLNSNWIISVWIICHFNVITFSFLICKRKTRTRSPLKPLLALRFNKVSWYARPKVWDYKGKHKRNNK